MHWIAVSISINTSITSHGCRTSLLVGGTSTFIFHWLLPDADRSACNCILFNKLVTWGIGKDDIISAGCITFKITWMEQKQRGMFNTSWNNKMERNDENGNKNDLFCLQRDSNCMINIWQRNFHIVGWQIRINIWPPISIDHFNWFHLVFSLAILRKNCYLRDRKINLPSTANRWEIQSSRQKQLLPLCLKQSWPLSNQWQYIQWTRSLSLGWLQNGPH